MVRKVFGEDLMSYNGNASSHDVGESDRREACRREDDERLRDRKPD